MKTKIKIFNETNEALVSRNAIKNAIRRGNEGTQQCFVCTTVDQKRRICLLLDRAIRNLRTHTYEELVEQRTITLFENELILKNGSCIKIGRCDITDAGWIKERWYDYVFIHEDMSSIAEDMFYPSECEVKSNEETKMSFEELMGGGT